MEIAGIVSKNIKARRAVYGFTQTQLAKKAKVSQATITQIENGKKLPSLTTLALIAGALKVEPYMLLQDVKLGLVLNNKKGVLK